MLVGYIKGLPADTGKESFITPDLAIHVIDFVHFLVNREGVAMEVSNKNNFSILIYNLSYYSMPVI